MQIIYVGQFKLKILFMLVLYSEFMDNNLDHNYIGLDIWKMYCALICFI
jgi:hypothetical protein